MNLCALVIGVILATQVTAADDRYAIPSDSDAALPAGSSLAPLGQVPTTLPSSLAQPPAGATPATPPPATPPAAAPPLGTFQPLGTSQPPAGGSTLRVAPQSNAADSPAESLGETSGSAAAKPGALAEPSALIRAMLTAPRDSRLTGQPVGLAEVVAGATSRDEQTALVDAYWNLCSSVADYYLGLKEQTELRRLRTLVSRVGPTWQQAESELAVRIGTSQRAAAASQRRLASMMGRSESQPLPLPADMPHCGDYRTRYEQIFAGRPSAEAADLNELLPLRYEELRDAAGAVARAEEWVDMVAAQRSDNSDGTGMLRALELLALRRRAFVQIARDFNQRIARYTELAAPGEIPPDVLVGMLIKTDRRVAGVDRERPPSDAGGSLRSTPATPPQSTRRATPATRGADWAPAGSSQTPRDDSVTPASAEIEDQRPTERRERSLLVPSRRQ